MKTSHSVWSSPYVPTALLLGTKMNISKQVDEHIISHVQPLRTSGSRLDLNSVAPSTDPGSVNKL